MTRSALILGASGSFGGAVALEMLKRGWRLRALARDPARLTGLDAETMRGDALDAVALTRAAAGVDVIVHGVNYPYHQWAPNMERVTSNALRAARAVGATLLFPGNVYGFGRQVGMALPETAGMQPCSVKGRLRVRLETMLKAATVDGKAQVLIVRAGDYFGPSVRNGYVDRIFGNAAARRSILAFGGMSVPHQWSYVPDLARLALDLLDVDIPLKPFEIIHDHGCVVASSRQFLRLVAQRAGDANLRIRRLPWPLLYAAGLFDPVLRELRELRYLFDGAVIIDDPRRQVLLPAFQRTPVEQAIDETLGSYRAAA